jgi:hypothetical protein
MTSTPGNDREELVHYLERARNELLASFRGLPAKEMTQPGVVGEWSVKDVLAHVTSWEEQVLPDLARLARGDTALLASVDLYATNYDPFNAIIMTLTLGLGLDQVLRELEIFRADFMAAVARLPDAVLSDGQFGHVLLKITAEHDEEHAGQISAWRQKQGL